MLYFLVTLVDQFFAGWAVPTIKSGYYLYVVGQCPTYNSISIDEHR